MKQFIYIYIIAGLIWWIFTKDFNIVAYFIGVIVGLAHSTLIGDEI